MNVPLTNLGGVSLLSLCVLVLQCHDVGGAHPLYSHANEYHLIKFKVTIVGQMNSCYQMLRFSNFLESLHIRIHQLPLNKKRDHYYNVKEYHCYHYVFGCSRSICRLIQSDQMKSCFQTLQFTKSLLHQFRALPVYCIYNFRKTCGI